MLVVLTEPVQETLVDDVFLPFLLRGIGAGQVDHQGLLVEGFQAGTSSRQAVAVVVALEVVHVFQQQCAAENIVEGNRVVGVLLDSMLLRLEA